MASVLIDPIKEFEGTDWRIVNVIQDCAPCVGTGIDDETRVACVPCSGTGRVRLNLAVYQSMVAEQEALKGFYPALDPNYRFRVEILRDLQWGFNPHDGGTPCPVLLAGPRGAGKTSVVKQYGAIARQPVVRVGCHPAMTARGLMGRLHVRDGSTVLVPGPVTFAMERGLWLLLDEVSGLVPEVANTLLPVLEPDGEVFVMDSESDTPRYITRHPNFRVALTDNVLGAKQEGKRFQYTGTHSDQNEAFMDRIGVTIHVPYLGIDEEFALVKAKVPGIDPDDLDGMCRVARNVRAMDSSVDFSTRAVLDWARRWVGGIFNADGTVTAHTEDRQILEVAGAAFLDKVSNAMDRDAIIEVIKRIYRAAAPATP